MIKDLYTAVLGWRLASHCETQFIIPSVPAETTLSFLIGPPASYHSMIIWQFSYGDILANVFRVYCGIQSQKGGGMAYHTGLLDPWCIRQGIPTWIYVSEDDRPLIFNLENTDTEAHYFQSWLWQLNVQTKDDLDEIERRIEKMGMLPEMIADLIIKQLQAAGFMPAVIR